MDPLTQGLIGAAAAQVVAGRRLRHAWLLGMTAGMAPDLDILIRSETDPLMAVQYHRHFTHALAFIPVGGVLVGMLALLFRRCREHWRTALLAATAAVGTHGLLDACTSYGTQLLLPFSNARIAWNWISIIDPLFTLTLLAGVVVAAATRARRAPAALALVIGLTYIGLGAVQRGRAVDAQQAIAQQRGHEIQRGEVFATIGNHLVWRSLYQSGEHLYADRIRVAWSGAVQWTPGTSVAYVNASMLTREEREDPRVVHDFGRFYWFSGGWVARALDDPTVYGDARYSLRTDAFDPIWGVRFSSGAALPTEWVSRTRERRIGFGELWSEIRGTHPAYQPLH
jgi:inner membrane protein